MQAIAKHDTAMTAAAQKKALRTYGLSSANEVRQACTASPASLAPGGPSAAAADPCTRPAAR